ncbi:hypothetical protein [Methylobacterium sp. B1]|nr:hypothetical protein [Methylobacterium sp. B1]
MALLACLQALGAHRLVEPDKHLLSMLVRPDNSLMKSLRTVKRKEKILLEADMIVFAGIFSAMAGFGLLLGLGAIEYPVAPHISSYGWALFVNAAAICGLLLFNLYHRHSQRLH